MGIILQPKCFYRGIYLKIKHWIIQQLSNFCWLNLITMTIVWWAWKLDFEDHCFSKWRAPFNPDFMETHLVPSSFFVSTNTVMSPMVIPRRLLNLCRSDHMIHGCHGEKEVNSLLWNSVTCFLPSLRLVLIVLLHPDGGSSWHNSTEEQHLLNK